MRTMLIPIIVIIICSLAQLTTTVDTNKQTLPGCGTIYKCFVPESCTASSPTPFSAQSIVKEVAGDTQVTKDCDAIIRFYTYATYWIHVWIESFKADNSIKSISFIHISQNEGTNTFECNVAPNAKGELEVKGKFKNSLISDQESKKIRIIDLKNESPLKCIFHVKSQMKDKSVIIQDVTDNEIQFIIKGATEIEGKATLTKNIYVNDVRCDPSDLKFETNEKIDSKKKYNQLLYSPENYFCEHKHIFDHMEYRPENSEAYVPVTKLICNDKAKFEIIPKGKPKETIEKHMPIKIRCVASAEYFCNDAVKSSSENSRMKLHQEMPIITYPAVKVKIKCPAGYPFIELNGKPLMNDNGKPISDDKFLCENRGQMRWTLDGRVLKASGPEIRCAKELNCLKIKKFPASVIVKGRLVKGVPACYDKGTMRVAEDQVINVFCEGKTGKFMYITTGNQTKEVGDATFTCEYEIIEDVQANQENKEKAYRKGGITIASIVLGLIVVCCVAVCLYCWLRIRRNARKIKEKEEKDDKEWDEWVRRKGKDVQHKKMNVGSQPQNKTSTSEQNNVKPMILSRKQENKGLFWRNNMKLEYNETPTNANNVDHYTQTFHEEEAKPEITKIQSMLTMNSGNATSFEAWLDRQNMKPEKKGKKKNAKKQKKEK